jgi:hypothetical protein
MCKSNKMQSECIICVNNNIDKNTACVICNNKICNECFVSIIKENIYTCPFCKKDITIDWLKIEKEVIINYFKKKEIEFKNELSFVKTLNYNLNIELYNIQNKLNNKKSRR